MIDGQKTPHHAVLKDYQQHPIRGTITHVDFHEVRLDQPIQATVARAARRRGARRQGRRRRPAGRRASCASRRCRRTIPEYIEVDLSGLELGDTLRLQDVPPVAGVTFLDDPAETVIANCSSPRGLTEAEEAAERGARRRGFCGVAPTAAGCRCTARRRGVILAALPSGRVGLDARPARRRAREPGPASTSATVTTSASWSSTSSRAATGDRSRPSSADTSAEVRIEGRRLALLKPDTYMNDSGKLGAAGRRVLQDTARDAARRPRRGRPRRRPAAGSARWRSRRSQRAPLDRRSTRRSRLPPAARRRRSARDAATRAPSPISCWRRSRRRTMRGRSSRGRPTRSRRSSRTVSTRRSARSTDCGVTGTKAEQRWHTCVTPAPASVPVGARGCPWGRLGTRRGQGSRGLERR